MIKWAPFAVRRDGPSWKVGYSHVGEEGPKSGDVKHSSEGGWGGAHSVLFGPVPLSWQFTVGYDRVEQHYPFTAYCWHAGDVDDDGGVSANLDLVGVEHLGKVGEPLTPYQVEMTVMISRFCAEQSETSGFARYSTQEGLQMLEGVWMLVEHNEVSNWPTACPSDRVLWTPILQQLREGDDMADEALRGIVADLKRSHERLVKKVEANQEVLVDVKQTIGKHVADQDAHS